MFKRVLSFLIVLSILISILVIPVVAAEFTVEEKATHLNHLSILSDEGYPLDQKLMRYEAAVYATRILGADAFINSNSATLKMTGFSDVNESMWYAPYIGYCTNKGIISGVGNNQFKPNDYVTEKAFLVILLGALGYKSGVDFSWNTIYPAAFSAGLVTDVSYIGKTQDNANFTRGDAIKILYNSLKAKGNGSDITVIDKLIDANVVDIKDAVEAGLIDQSELNVRIESITTLSNQRLLLTFNRDITELNDDNIEIYQSDNKKRKLSTQILSINRHEVILKTSSQKKDTEYNIIIEDITDSEGYTTEKLTSTFSGYVADEIKSDFFRIKRAEAVSSNIIHVYFTHPVNANAEYSPYYTIMKDGYTVVSGNFYNMNVKCLSGGEGIAVELKDNVLTPGSLYTIEIDGDLVSSYGTGLNEEYGETVDFYAISDLQDSSITYELDVEDIFPLDRRTIEVHFTKEVDSFFANQFLNYIVYTPKNTAIQVDNVTLIEDGELKNKALRLGLASNLDGRSDDYELYINFLTDISKSSSISQKRFEFSGEYPDSNDIEIVDVDALNNRLISVVLDKPLVPSYAEDLEYYTIFNKNGSTLCKPINVVYTPLDNPLSKVTLLLPSDKTLSEKKDYKVEVSRHLPFNIDSTSSSDVRESFSGSSDSYKSPEIKDAVIIGKDTIKATFSSDISQVTPNISVDNYSLEYNEGIYAVKKVPLSVTYIDSKTLILRFDSLDYNTSYMLKWNKTTDMFGLKDSSIMGNGGLIKVLIGK